MIDELDIFNGVTDTPLKLYPGNLKPKQHSAPVSLAPSRIDVLNSLPASEYKINGVDTQCYTIGSLCKVLDRKAVTIRSWEQKGWMRPPKFRTRPPDKEQVPGATVKGRRLYTRNQVEFLIRAFESCHLDDPKRVDWTAFKSLLKNDYPTS